MMTDDDDVTHPCRLCGTRWEQSMGAAPSFATPRGGGKQRAMSLAARRIVGELEEGMGDDKERNSLLAFAEMLENRGSASGRSRGALTAQILFRVAAVVVGGGTHTAAFCCCCRCRCRGWWCRCSSLFACCLLLPSLGVPCFCSRVNQAWAALACHARTPAQLTHQEHPRWAHIFETPRTPCAQAQNPE